MKYFFYILFFILIKFASCTDYIIEFQAKVKNLKEFKISKDQLFRSYDLEGTFTDNLGNFGKSYTIIVSDIKKGKILRLEGTNETIFSNNEKIYGKALREKSDIDAGIASIKIIGATDKLKSLIGNSCIISVRYFEDAIFGLQKCKLSDEQRNILRNNS